MNPFKFFLQSFCLMIQRIWCLPLKNWSSLESCRDWRLLDQTNVSSSSSFLYLSSHCFCLTWLDLTFNQIQSPTSWPLIQQPSNSLSIIQWNVPEVARFQLEIFPLKEFQIHDSMILFCTATIEQYPWKWKQGKRSFFHIFCRHVFCKLRGS